MIETLKLIVDYIGGPNVIWCIGSVLAGTQVAKIGLKAFNQFSAERLRIFPFVIGAFAGWEFIEYSARGAMIGMTCGLLASMTWFVVAARLEFGSWEKAMPKIADRMMGK